MDNITIKQVKEIKDLKNTSENIKDWKRKMKLKAKELGIKDSEILDISRGEQLKIC